MATEKRIVNGETQYYIDFTYAFPDGTKRRIRERSPVNTLKGAKKHEEDRRSGLQKSGPNPKADIPTVAEFWERFETYSKNNNKPSTLAAKDSAYRHHLNPAFGDMRLDEITAEEIEEFKEAKRDAGLSDKSINNYLTILKTVLNLAVEYSKTTGLVAVPNIKSFRLVEEDYEFLHFDEGERFLAAAELVSSPPGTPPSFTKTFAIVLLKTGIRIGELLALKWEDIDLKKGQMTIKRGAWTSMEYSPKSGRRRDVPLSPQTLTALIAYRHLQGPYVFCTADGNRLTHSRVREVVPNICKRAGVAKAITNHSLRHTFASWLVMRGRSLLEVQQLLGHSTISMVMRYAHLAPDVKREAVNTLDAAPPPEGAVQAR